MQANPTEVDGRVTGAVGMIAVADRKGFCNLRSLDCVFGKVVRDPVNELRESVCRSEKIVFLSNCCKEPKGIS